MGVLESGFHWLLDFFFRLTNNHGLAIVLLTILIRLILVPLTVSQFKSMARLQQIQPKLKELEAKYKSQPEEYQKRVMELYKENKINPMGGCLPLLLQLPVLWALFSVLRKYEFTTGFLWISDLTAPDPIYILPILSGLTTFLHQAQTSGGDQSQRAMLLIMPIFIGYLSLNFPAGLVLYWVASNVFSIIQQFLISKHLPATPEGGKA